MANSGVCSIPDCGKPVRARGWCGTHYARWKRNGGPEKLRGLLGRRMSEITGQRFGKLVALSVAEMGTGRGVRWLCRCDCGNTTEVLTKKLRNGHTQSCGRCRGTHRLSKSPEWASWTAMKSRCTNPKTVMYHRYGGRGIKVCDRWSASFEEFLADMGPRPDGTSLDRIDNDRDYEPSNCRWAQKLEQDNNRSTSVHFTVNGVSDSLPQLLRKVMPRPTVCLSTAYWRIKRGWRVEDALYVAPRSADARDIDKRINS